MQAVTGHVILDKNGEFLAWAAHLEVAIARFRGDPLAHRVERCSDGVAMYGRPRKKKPGERFDEAVCA
jgi:hypothetical protein